MFKRKKKNNNKPTKLQSEILSMYDLFDAVDTDTDDSVDTDKED